MENNYKILHFEDDSNLSDILVNAFKDKNFEYKHYLCSPVKEEQLIKLVLSENPDLVIMDILMPKMDGFTATKILKNNPQTKDVPIIGFDNLSDKKYIDMAKEYGMVDYFLKQDVRIDEFITKIKEYLMSPDDYKSVFNEHKEK